MKQKRQASIPFGDWTPDLPALHNPGLLAQFDALDIKVSDPSRNYVVFDDKLIEILRRYGLLPPVAAGAAGLLGGNEAEASQ
ncbi:MAG: hypothetical protein O2782_18925 [bacterium]|nr:hypothetical protein [bacterium]